MSGPDAARDFPRRPKGDLRSAPPSVAGPHYNGGMRALRQETAGLIVVALVVLVFLLVKYGSLLPWGAR